MRNERKGDRNTAFSRVSRKISSSPVVDPFGKRGFLKFERAKSRQLNQKVYARRLSRRGSYTRRVSGDAKRKWENSFLRRACHYPLLFPEIKHRWPSRRENAFAKIRAKKWTLDCNWVISWQLIKNIKK